MPVVIVDETLKRELESFSTSVELRNQNGRLLGRFEPECGGRHARRPADFCPNSDAELDAMRNEKGGRTLEEIRQDWLSH